MNVVYELTYNNVLLIAPQAFLLILPAAFLCLISLVVFIYEKIPNLAVHSLRSTAIKGEKVSLKFILTLWPPALAERGFILPFHTWHAFH
jgi:hypothetical protein